LSASTSHKKTLSAPANQPSAESNISSASVMSARLSASERRARLKGSPGGAAKGRGARPVPGRAYRIELCSAHFRSSAGSFLDAHRSEKRDRLSNTATLASFHACKAGSEPGDGCAGVWVVEALSTDAVDEVAGSDVDARTEASATCFRLRLAEGHFGAQTGAHLCGLAYDAPVVRGMEA